MEIVQTQKFIRMSPRKLRLVAPMVKGLSPTKAVDILPHVGKKAAEPLAKVIKAAIANAKDRNISEADLVFKEIQINDGPRLKRGRAVGHGRWHPYQKKMSHIRVVLTTKEPKAIKDARENIESTDKNKKAKSKASPGKTKKGTLTQAIVGRVKKVNAKKGDK